MLLGSGASCIYPLLGAKLNNWHFLATEVDDSSASYAKENVKRNGLESNISGKGNINVIILLLFCLLFLSLHGSRLASKRHLSYFQTNEFTLRKKASLLSSGQKDDPFPLV